MNTKELFNQEVYDSDANRIGKVVDIIFDLSQGVISHIVVKIGLLKKREVAVDLIDKSGDSIVLTVPKNDLNGKIS